MNRAALLTRFALLGLMLVSSGCYYLQAAQGQLDVLGRSEPLDQVIGKPTTPEALVERLELLKKARRFAVEELGLPDNASYTSYADVERDYVVWNVFATPEFSLTPKRWCYPVVGCVSYRGYFSREAAYRKADRLSRRGYDVAVGGVAAYSTLGRFDDPVLSTMMHWDDIRLVSVLFHELAHQVLYIKDDTAFNESFATAVEQFGIARWLKQNGREAEIDRYRAGVRVETRLKEHIDAARSDLARLYEMPLTGEAMREEKTRRLEVLAETIREELESSGGATNPWLSSELNNARLVPIALYEGHVPAFEALLAECLGDLECFYREAELISELDSADRIARLEELAADS